MSKFVKTALLVALGVVSASAAFAIVPDPTFSTCGSGGQCLVIDPAATPGTQITITVKDQFNAIIAGSTVTIDFTGCATVLCSNQGAGFTVGGGGKTVAAVTNGSGQVTFFVRGGNPCNGVYKIYADGVQICQGTHLATTDLNGDKLVDVSDLSIFAFNQGASNVDSDYNCDALVDVSDLAIFAASQAGSGAGFCP